MNIVLHQPEIPHNTGAIGRTCLVTGSGLHLIRPYGFFLDEKSLRRSGLDYWHKLNVREYDNFQEFHKKNPHGRFFFIETTGGKLYSDANFEPGDFLIFGSETSGLPPEILNIVNDTRTKEALNYGSENPPAQVLRVPMKSGQRSLNLSVTAGIVLYEALRQTGFAMLQ